MIYDCVIFFNELDLLEVRLNELKNVVDKFVIVEASFTHSSKPKEFCFENNKERYQEFLDQIIYWKVTDLPHFPPQKRRMGVLVEVCLHLLKFVVQDNLLERLLLQN